MRDLTVAKNGAGRKDGEDSDPALLVVGHGSRDPRGAREFHELVALVRERNPMLAVEGGFIELSWPPISECVNRLRAAGARKVTAVPLMLLAAGHAKDDIPATLVREKTSHPEVNFRYGRALGIRPELLALMDERISAAVPEEEQGETAVLVVGRGSSDPDANSDLFKISRLFYEGRLYPMVEPAYVSMTPPASNASRGSAPAGWRSSPTSSSPASSRSVSTARARNSPPRIPTFPSPTRATSGRTRRWQTSLWSATTRP